jgi:stage III sporulation protein AA
MKEEEILGILPLHIRTIIKQAGINWDELQEIRLRIQKPVILKYNAKTCYLSEQGKITGFCVGLYKNGEVFLNL